ncbi:Lipid A biosynthesis lauroyl acyltransferase [Rickettsiales endosymbiont of Paramecium tredecaurelia]|uniref:lysophospholipid acyltransferase family protein n=1 Tax=Candidatus Sarmatiella mevalonica TaxID=2770581 RepID=UPI0019219497|nr:hypothetical protein [Candidatus Sarmatiella mevalonica]MBL3285041.1 Lipid A biosynthesis lauroyl acyltransferase [Candidatus Sarmatiella mevalonica]
MKLYIKQLIKRCLLHPLEYLGALLLINFSRMLGVERASNFFGRLFEMLGPKIAVNKTVLQNLSLVFDRKSSTSTGAEKNEERRKLARKIWQNFGRFIGELPHVYSMSASQVAQRLEVEGVNHIIQLVKENENFIIYTGHFANWEMALNVLYSLPKHKPYCIVYQTLGNPHIEKIIKNLRPVNGSYLLDIKKNAAEIIKVCRAGHVLVMLVDQRLNSGIEVPLLGNNCMTPDGPATIAIKFNYRLVPLQFFRTSEKVKFKAIIHAPHKFHATAQKTQDVYHITKAMNDNLSRWILARPEQWFWLHNRWKM